MCVLCWVGCAFIVFPKSRLNWQVAVANWIFLATSDSMEGHCALALGKDYSPLINRKYIKRLRRGEDCCFSCERYCLRVLFVVDERG